MSDVYVCGGSVLKKRKKGNRTEKKKRTYNCERESVTQTGTTMFLVNVCLYQRSSNFRSSTQFHTWIDVKFHLSLLTLLSTFYETLKSLPFFVTVPGSGGPQVSSHLVSGFALILCHTILDMTFQTWHDTHDLPLLWLKQSTFPH